MRKLSMAELNRISSGEYKEAVKMPVIVVLDNIRSLMNIGSIFRTADAFRIEAIYLCGITACPPHREIQKTALGATESVKWEYFASTKEAIAKLKVMQYLIVSIEQTTESIPLHKARFQAPLALVFGNELEGVSEDAIHLSDEVIEIPQFGTKHSLNVAVCGGIVIWQCYLKFQSSLTDHQGD